MQNTDDGDACFAKITGDGTGMVCPKGAQECAPAPEPLSGCPTKRGGEISAECASAISAIWKNDGGSDDTCAVAVSVALAESAGDAHSINHNTDKWSSVDRGLWQLSSHWHPEVSEKCAYDKDCNAKAAVRISKDGTDFSSWTTFKKGLNRPYLDIAKAACN